MARMYDEEHRKRVNDGSVTVEDLLNISFDGEYCGYIIENGQITGVEIYSMEV